MGGTLNNFTQRAKRANIAEEAEQVLRLRLRGLSYRAIGEQMGFSHHRARRRCEWAIHEMIAEPTEEIRKLELARLDQLHQAAVAVLEHHHVLVSDGRPVKMDGQALLDTGPVLQAIDRLLKIQDRRAKLLGLDAPAKVDATVYEVKAEDIELAELVREAQAKAAAEEQAIREQAPRG